MADDIAAERLARAGVRRLAAEATGWRTVRRIALGALALLAVVVMVPLFAFGSGPAVPASAGEVGLPPAFLDAYVVAVGDEAAEACGIRWSVLAAVGQVESGNGAGRVVGDDGVVTPSVVGPALDGSPGVRAIADTDEGLWDSDATWDRAVGPLQFLPSTWRALGRDGNGDDFADPNNIYDAARAAVELLCADGVDLSDADALHRALLRYNASDSYAAVVEAWVARFEAMAEAESEFAPLSASGHSLPLDRVWFDEHQEWLSGRHHDYPAADLPVPEGTPVYAAAGGRVRGVSSIGTRCGLGLVVGGADGWDYVYCHASQVVVRAGDVVGAGELVARSGNTGRSTGPHLHFGIQTPAAERVCPQPFLRAWLAGDADVAITADCIS